MKIPTFNMKGPLKIVFEYPDNLNQISFMQVYYSWSNFEPSESNNDGKQLNPKILKIIDKFNQDSKEIIF